MRSRSCFASAITSASLCVLVACSGAEPPSADAPHLKTIVTKDSASYLKHEVVVKVGKDRTPADLEKLVRKLGGTVLDADSALSRELGYIRIALPETVTADDAIEALRGEPAAESVDKNFVSTVEKVPSDPLLSSMWGLNQIHMAEAWDISVGQSSVLVAVADTGIDFKHPDLKLNIFVNGKETPGDGIDNDGNGYIDDRSGWDPVNRDNDPSDDHGHGTHVSGTIGATGNNGVGVTGINWFVEILPLKVCSGAGQCYSTAIAEAMLYARKMNARVVNASLGGVGSTAYEKAAIEELGKAGGLLVAAAGNSTNNNDKTAFYPAGYAVDTIVAVAATDRSDKLASFSNYGATSVDIAAPGVEILSTVKGGSYQAWNGTSMASPHVAGAAALALSKNPGLKPLELKEALMGTATKVTSLEGKVVSGRLNVAALLTNQCAGSNNGCSADAFCLSNPTGPFCECKDGFSGDGKTCADVDECALGTDTCDANATCANTKGGFECACNPGFVGDGTTCADVNECTTGADDCGANALCLNNKGGYACECLGGLEGDGRTCTDIDECARKTDLCSPLAACDNVFGSYDCVCPDGYAGDGFTCGDFNECALGLDSCDPHASCANKVGSYTCVCDPGFAGDGLFCFDLDECASGTIDCGDKGFCRNTPGAYECACPSGYVHDGKNCVDANECNLGTDKCDANAKCDNTTGGYTCTCAGGFTGNGTTCTDVDECSLNTDNCGDNAKCTNLPGAFACSCLNGYKGDGYTCADIDECLGANNCVPGGTCVNKPGNYSCICNNGYDGGGASCFDIDECAKGLDNCADHGGECKNTSGGFSCACKAGFKGDGLTCTDIDECALGTAQCAPGAKCGNTAGGYTCTCPAGYQGDGKTCIDIDECKADNDNCGTNAVCNNLPGSFSCACAKGYTGNGLSCVDTDECALGTDTCKDTDICVNTAGGFTCKVNECASDALNDCSENATCTDTDPGYTCKCKRGYAGNGKYCVNIDECALGLDDCPESADCKDVQGGFSCSCKAGYVAAAGTGIAAAPADTGNEYAEAGVRTRSRETSIQSFNPSDECGEGVQYFKFDNFDDACVSHSTEGLSEAVVMTRIGNQCAFNYEVLATPVTGSVRICSKYAKTDDCVDGRPLSGTLDFTKLPRALSHLTFCIGDTTDGSGDGGSDGDGDDNDDTTPPEDGELDPGETCEDRNECGNGAATCAPNTLCKNSDGGYRCDCAPGYSGADNVCSKDGGVDECALGLNDCPSSSLCQNTDDGYQCVCPPGYKGDGYTCSDLDECGLNTDNCDTNATCKNLPGSFSCTCSKGYAGNGITCADIDECALGTDECVDPTICVNTAGRYLCTCPTNFSASAGACSPNECALGTHDCNARAICTDRADGFSCACKEGYKGDGKTCVDVDECALGTDRCDDRASCTNNDGGYDCTCPAGFAGNGKVCVDINECATGANDCGANSVCTNVAPGFSCACKPGYRGDGKACVEIDECTEKTADCDVNAACGNLPGSYSCLCKAGYIGNGIHCDLDECATGQDNCSDNAKCTNTDPGFTCECNEGFTGNGAVCEDLDECATGFANCGNQGVCKNTYPGYECICNPGYESNGRACVLEARYALEITASGDHTCALLDNHSVRCWGSNQYGQLGLGHTRNVGDDELAEAYPYVNVGEAVQQISAGVGHTCALLESGNVRCWGRNEHGQLGYGHTKTIGDDEEPWVAGDVDLLEAATQISAGGEHTCALLASGRLQCWGLGIDGQLGYGSTASIGDDESAAFAGEVPEMGSTLAIQGPDGIQSVDGPLPPNFQLPPDCEIRLDSVAQISAGRDHTCAVLTSGKVHCWGRGTWGQLGYGNTKSVGDDEKAMSPGAVNVGEKAVSVASGWYHSCALLAGGAVRCWGYGYTGQLGNGYQDDIGDNEAPAWSGDIDLGGPALEIATGTYHTCAVLWNGDVRCWGYGESGRLGYGNEHNIGDDETPSFAKSVKLAGEALDVAAGFAHSCALMNSGAIHCWGDAEYGQLGTGSKTDIGDDETPGTSSPVFHNLVNECDLAIDDCDAMAACTDRAFGFDCACKDGFIGDGYTCDNVNECEQDALACGSNSTCADTFGGFTCGCEDGYAREGSQCVWTGAKVVDLVAGTDHTCARYEDGTLRCWGGAGYGRLGYGSQAHIGDTESPSSMPVLALGRPVEAVALGSEHTCAVVEGGTVRCWGRGLDGRLGNLQSVNIGDDETAAAATDVALSGPAVAVTAGAAHSCALLDDGAVQCWGRGGQGRLGYGNLNTLGDNEAPASAGVIELGGAAVAISSGDVHTCALLESGAVRCWGQNVYGQLGYGDTQDIGDDESPADAGDVDLGSPALSIATGKFHTCALLDTGAVRCWGYGTFGSLGYGSTALIGNDEPPVEAGDISLGGKAVAIAAGGYGTCAVLTSGELSCWGYGGWGSLGYGSTENIGDTELPSSVDGHVFSGGVQGIALGMKHACALSKSEVVCWGDGSWGRLGYGNVSSIGMSERVDTRKAVEVYGN